MIVSDLYTYWGEIISLAIQSTRLCCSISYQTQQAVTRGVDYKQLVFVNWQLKTSFHLHALSRVKYFNVLVSVSFYTYNGFLFKYKYCSTSVSYEFLYYIKPPLKTAVFGVRFEDCILLRAIKSAVFNPYYWLLLRIKRSGSKAITLIFGINTK